MYFFLFILLVRCCCSPAGLWRRPASCWPSPRRLCPCPGWCAADLRATARLGLRACPGLVIGAPACLWRCCAASRRRCAASLWRRSAHYPSFANFDAPNRGACTVSRQSSNTPLQALTLMNDPAYVEMARAFAARIQEETVNMDTTRRLAHAFRLALCRNPGADELEVLRKIYFTALDTDGEDAEAWFDVATTLLNLHETITK